MLRECSVRPIPLLLADPFLGRFDACPELVNRRQKFVRRARVAENEGNWRDQAEAANKLFADLKNIKVTGEEVMSYDTASPLG